MIPNILFDEATAEKSETFLKILERSSNFCFAGQLWDIQNIFVLKRMCYVPSSPQSDFEEP